MKGEGAGLTMKRAAGRCARAADNIRELRIHLTDTGNALPV